MNASPKLSRGWLHVGMKFLPFADAATAELPLGRLLRLSLFQISVGMALAMPILSLAALDRHAKIRGTAASGQAFVQMLLSTVSAGLIVPLVWSEPLGLAMAMAAYLLFGCLVLRLSLVWRNQ